MAKSDLITFAQVTSTNFLFESKEFHEQIANALMQVYTGKIKRLILELPPRSGKSELSVINFVARCLGQNPGMKLAVAGYNQDIADFFATNIMMKIKSDQYKSIFPEMQLHTEKLQHFTTKKGGYVHSVGVGGAFTGFGYHIAILDDPHKDKEEAYSPVMRQKVRDRYQTVFLTRMQDSKSGIVVIHTRWHTEDVIGRILSNYNEQVKRSTMDGMTPEPRHRITIRGLQVNEDANPYDQSWNNKYKSYRPHRFNMDYLWTKKQELGISNFQALYQQDPLSAMGGIFKKIDLQYFLYSEFENPESPLRKQDMEMIIAIDPAFSTDASSDDASVCLVGRHIITNHRYIFDIYAGTSAPSITIEYAFMMADKWKARGFTIKLMSVECVNINKRQTEFVKQLKEAMDLRNHPITIYDYKPVGKKDDRIKFTMEPITSSKRLHIIRNEGDHEAFTKLEQQFLGFPATEKKDVIDSVTQANQVHNATMGGSKAQESQAPKIVHNKISGKVTYIQPNGRPNKF